MEPIQWLKEYPGTDTELAKRLQVDPSYLSHIKAGRKNPFDRPGRFARKIVKESGGEVSLQEIFDPSNEAV